jgi:acyl carrier protein
MSADEIRATVLRILGTIAPEADLTTIQPDVSFRDQLDIDSMDFLNFLVAVDKELRVDIPEGDYAQLATLNDCVDYIARHLEAGRDGADHR